MRIVTSIAAMQRLAARCLRQGTVVSLVPTMGYLHAGHLSLVKRARRLVGPRGQVVLSIYVNPTQFGPKEDFSRYPRNMRRDVRMCRAADVDVVFAPTDEDMYPGRSRGDFSTYVVEEKFSRGMEGASRPTHFRGVTTIVAKLFHLVQPRFAVFGAKDYQQTAVIDRIVRDLNFPVKIVVAPTHRELDGLAMSSRNKYLKGEQRRQALVLWQAMKVARTNVRQARAAVSAARLKSALKKLIARQSGARLDYLEFFDPATFDPVPNVKAGTHLALAVFIGKTRLIDNVRL